MERDRVDHADEALAHELPGDLEVAEATRGEQRRVRGVEHRLRMFRGVDEGGRNAVRRLPELLEERTCDRLAAVRGACGDGNGLADREHDVLATRHREGERDAERDAERRGDSLHVRDRLELLETQPRRLLDLAVEVLRLEDEIARVPPPRADDRERRELLGGEQADRTELGRREPARDVVAARPRQTRELRRAHRLERARITPAHLEAVEAGSRPRLGDAQPTVLAAGVRAAEVREHDVLLLVQELGVVHGGPPRSLI